MTLDRKLWRSSTRVVGSQMLLCFIWEAGSVSSSSPCLAILISIRIVSYSSIFTTTRCLIFPCLSSYLVAINFLSTLLWLHSFWAQDLLESTSIPTKGVKFAYILPPRPNSWDYTRHIVVVSHATNYISLSKYCTLPTSNLP